MGKKTQTSIIDEKVTKKSSKTKGEVKTEKSNHAKTSDNAMEERIANLEMMCRRLQENFAEAELRLALKHWDNHLLQTCATKYKVDVSSFNAKKRTNMPQLIAALIGGEHVPDFWKETLKDIFRGQEQFRESKSKRAKFAGDTILAIANKDDDFLAVFADDAKRQQVRRIRQCCQDLCNDDEEKATSPADKSDSE